MRLRFIFFVFFVCFVVQEKTAFAQNAQNAQPSPTPTHLSALASEPDWSQLAKFQETITRAEFEKLLDTIYAPDDAWEKVIAIHDGWTSISTNAALPFVLRFALDENKTKPIPRFWKPARTLPRAPDAKPLRGVNIALDPGHLGGSWAKMEERWFQMGENTKPVTEGDMTLRVAKLLAPKLGALGADVTFVRRTTEPVTNLRPQDLRKQAVAALEQQGIHFVRENYDGASDPLKLNSIKWQSELLFYRTAEIRKRAQIVNRKLQPDLVLCLHFNAEDWADEKNPLFTEHNHLHLLVNGCYSANELALDDVRFDMLVKLLDRCCDEEIPAAEHVANFMAGATGLPPYQYTKNNARRVGENPYIWARNLLANRLYRCPVVYIEPYVMNNQSVWERVQLGDYEGERLINGELRKSIFREYADSVANGLASYFSQTRKK